MKVHIYVLFLSIWTINSLARNPINETSATTTTNTTVDTAVSKGTKLDDFRKRLLGFIVGIMIIAFTFTCFCLLHYNCMVEEVQSPGGLNKENMAAISSWVSKVSACQPDVITEDILETQPLLLKLDQTYGPVCPDKQPIANSVAKSIRPPILQNPCIPSNAPKSTKYTNIEHSSTSCSLKYSNRQLESNRPTKLSNPRRLHKQSHLEKTYKKRGLKMSNKLAYACKLANTNSSFSDKQVSPWLAIKKTSAKQIPQSSSSISHKQITSTKPCRMKKPSLSRGHYEVRKPVNRENASSPKPTEPETCRYYKNECLICNTSRFILNDFSGTEKRLAGYFYGSVQRKPCSEPFCETEYKYKTYEKSVSNDTMKAYDSEDSNAEIVIICDTSHDDITAKESFQY
ncbi:uncharacterized protein CXorf66 homolog [Mastomys coucha]|uniref:uncharacterized protein CXorf66 homolog n=1 Tax=Mastomys coucha TaxID=35658 RepID=UPI001262A9B4|nr:uncharacterized protein CXorf66 homolog [Mastomys coucha]